MEASGVELGGALVGWGAGCSSSSPWVRLGEAVSIEAEDACELVAPQAKELVIFDYDTFELRE